MREGITLACPECKRRNYRTNKNKKNNAERIEMMKYCKWCHKHTLELCKRNYSKRRGKGGDACRSEGGHAFSFRRSASGCGSQGMHSPAHFHRRGGENHRIPERILYRE